MGNYILRSMFRGAISMFVVVSSVFLILRLGPQDPAQFILGDFATAETIRNLQVRMGLDKPLYAQYVSFLKDMTRGDFGRSYLNNEPVLRQLTAVLPYTIELVAAALIFGLLIGIPPGILCAVKYNGSVDHGFRLLTLIGISIPVFVLGILLIQLFSIELNWLPAIGVGQAPDVKTRLTHLILPGLSCGIMMWASITRLTRSSLLDIFCRDYIRTARAKGVHEIVVIIKHALRNALLPLVTFVGIYINILLGSAVLTEVIFTRPGVGRLVVEGIKSSDFPVVQTVIMFYAGAVIIVNVAIDILYSVIDPRIVYK